MDKYNWFNIQTGYLTIYKKKLRKRCFFNQQNINRLSQRSSEIYSQRGIYNNEYFCKFISYLNYNFIEDLKWNWNSVKF